MSQPYSPPRFSLTPLPAFNDNYFWLLDHGQQALVVDPGDAKPVLAYLAQHPELQLTAILITHHHPDHVGGVADLVAQTGATVYGPAREKMPTPYLPLQNGQSIDVLGLSFKVIDVPGHTAGHIAYFCPEVRLDAQAVPVLFCGDTLFSAGCGRLFEGTPAQMLDSLDRLASLPGNTRVCPAHEYTLSNLSFALAVEPGNAALQHYARACQTLRRQALPTLPTQLDQELAVNPFLRSRHNSVMQAVKQRHPEWSSEDWNEATVFGQLRAWKNDFK